MRYDFWQEITFKKKLFLLIINKEKAVQQQVLTQVPRTARIKISIAKTGQLELARLQLMALKKILETRIYNSHMVSLKWPTRFKCVRGAVSSGQSGLRLLAKSYTMHPPGKKHLRRAVFKLGHDKVSPFSWLASLVSEVWCEVVSVQPLHSCGFP